MELICLELRGVDRNYLQKAWDVHLSVIVYHLNLVYLVLPIVILNNDEHADNFGDWVIYGEYGEFTYHNSDDDGNDDVNHRTVALNLLMQAANAYQ